MTDIQKEYCEEKGLIYIKPENTEIADYINWLETQIQALRIHNVSNQLCDCKDFTIKGKMFVCKECGKGRKSLSA